MAATQGRDHEMCGDACPLPWSVIAVSGSRDPRSLPKQRRADLSRGAPASHDESMVEQITTALTAAEAYGRAAWRVNILLPVDASVTGQRVHPPGLFFAGDELTTPSEEDTRRALVNGWLREYMREAGVPQWEPLP